MAPSRTDALNQSIDIAGSSTKNSSLNVGDEALSLGAPIAGASGSTATVLSVSGGVAIIGGLTGRTANDVGNCLVLSGAASSHNNGPFPIVSFISSTSLGVSNSSAVAPDGYNGSISWMLRVPYSLQDDLNYERSDRKAIKGVDYNQTVAPYQRPDAVGTSVSTNLTNISGKTTDAIAYTGTRQSFGLTVNFGSTKILMNNTGQLKHIDAVNTLGIPCFDVAPFIGDFKSCFVKILDGYSTGSELTVLSGAHVGERIFGVTNQGSSVSPDSIEILFYSCPLWEDCSVGSNPYTWEAGLPSIINVRYGYNQRLDGFDSNIFRNDLTLPNITSSGISPTDHETLRQLIHFIDEGPADGFASGAYKEITPFASPFPTSVIWYTDATKSKKIVEKTIVRSGVMPSTITWKVYNVDGITVAHTVIDNITYINNVFETNRVRTIS